MEELTMNVSWLAVVVGAFAAFVLGWIWFSPMLFGKKWAQDSGLDLAAAGDISKRAMLAQLSGLSLMSWFVGVTVANNALPTAILGTLAFTVLGYSGGMFAKKTRYVRVINATYRIAALVVMILCQSLLGGAM